MGVLKTASLLAHSCLVSLEAMLAYFFLQMVLAYVAEAHALSALLLLYLLYCAWFTCFIAALLACFAEAHAVPPFVQ